MSLEFSCRHLTLVFWVGQLEPGVEDEVVGFSEAEAEVGVEVEVL